MKRCPQCGQEVAADARRCPNCGWEPPPIWPPPPGGFGSPAGTPPPAEPGAVARGVLYGMLFFVVLAPLSVVAVDALRLRYPYSTDLIAAVPVIVGGLALGVYFRTRRPRPVFARAFGWTALGMFAVALGALSVCYPFLAALDHQQGGTP